MQQLTNTLLSWAQEGEVCQGVATEGLFEACMTRIPVACLHSNMMAECLGSAFQKAVTDDSAG